MSPKGKPIGKKIGHGGLINLDELVAHFAGLKGSAAFFEEPAAADAAALGYGWQVIDGDHRCPDCAKQEAAAKDAQSPYAEMIERRGCYIDWGRANEA